MRRFHQAIRVVFAKSLVLLASAGLLTLVILASADIFMPFGRFDPMHPFNTGDPWSAISGAGVLLMSVALMVGVSLLNRHKPTIYSVVLFLGLTFLILSMRDIVGWLGFMIAQLGNFPHQHSLPTKSETVRRYVPFVCLSAVSLLGLIPAYPLRSVIDRGASRRFRRLLKTKRKQRANHD